VVDFFNEVDEEVRAADTRSILRKLLPWIIGAVVLAIVGVGGYWGWSSYTQHNANKASEAYDRGLKALASQDNAAADLAFAEAAKAGSRAYKSLALSQRAGILVSQNRIPDAVKMMDQAADEAPSPIMADLDRLKSAYLLMDKAPYAEIEKRLTPLIEKDRPYRAYAREALAMAKLMAPGRAKEARGDFILLKLDATAGDDVRERANAAIALIDSGATGQIAAIVKAAAALPPPAGPAGGYNPFAAAPPGPGGQDAGAPQQ
jgi:hypothetical protein